MFFRPLLLSVLTSLAAVIGCAIAPTTPAPATAGSPSRPPLVATSGPIPSATDDEADVGKEARYEPIARLALARAPEIQEARARADAAMSRVKRTGHLPDLEVKYELWAQPIARPYALGEAQMHMFGLRQAFPAPGTLDAQTRIAIEEAGIALEGQRTRELEIVQSVRKECAAYARATFERKLHEEHVALVSETIEVARLYLQNGKVLEQDVLRLEIENTRLHDDIVTLDAEIATSRARLNTMMGRPLDAALGTPVEVTPGDVELHFADLATTLRASRPELVAADGAIRREQASVAEATSAGRWPTLMLGADYMVMPGAPQVHNYGVMLQLSLPWLGSRHDDEVRAAERSVAAERSAKASIESSALLQLREAATRYEAARKNFDRLDRELLPLTKRQLEATEGTFSAGGGSTQALLEALRGHLDARIDQSRAVERLEVALADLERVVGAEIVGARKSVGAK